GGGGARAGGRVARGGGGGGGEREGGGGGVWAASDPGGRAGSPPGIGAAAAGRPEPLRAAAVRELVGLDAHYRRRAGESPSTADYAARFPDLDPDWLAGAVGADPAGEEEPAPVAAGLALEDYALI